MAALADMQELLGEFLAEAGELLDDVDRGLVALERAPQDAELLNRVFRGFHTIKGGAGFLEAAALVDLCHRTETLFDRLRSGKLDLRAELMDTILAATGEVRRMFGEMAGGAMPSASPASLLEALAAAATGAAPAAPAAGMAPEPAPATAPAAAAPVPGGGSAEVPDWHALYAALVPAPHAPAQAAADAPRAAPPAEAPPPAAPAPASAAAAPRAPAAAPAPKPAAENTIRVDTARYDQILNLSGEIGLTRNRLACVRTSLVQGVAQGEALKALDQVVNAMDMLVGDLQNAVMKARLQPVGRVFQKYNRLARDVARQLGKEVELEIEGEATEVDKTILDALNDPLVHLVRNAVDHGVEMPAEREAAGKPRKAKVRLAARQEGDRIVIEVADDGRGMRAEAIRAKAVEKGLLGAEAAAALDERASLALIFLPGFSTKEAVSDLSGRGVGMDVVKTNIHKLKGRVDIQSEPGRGSRVVIVLPLTLAIMPVLALGVCGQRYALPLAAVQEVLNAEPAALDAVAGVAALRVRGEALPFIDLAGPLGRRRGEPPAVAVIAQVGEQLLALGADACYGRDEVMLKPLEGFKPRGVAGATLAGDGSLVVVLELAELLGLPA
jgi:two-component system chemotaxis sensor kinase CheA